MVDVSYRACRALLSRPVFSPYNLNVHVGDTVTWTWSNPSEVHSTTSLTGGWDSGVHHGPFTFSHTFTQVGTFYYHCSVGYTNHVDNPPSCTSYHADEDGFIVVNP